MTTVGGERYYVTRNSRAHIYQQDYSVIAGFLSALAVKDGYGRTVMADNDLDDYATHVAGITTKTLPANLVATCTGKALTEIGNAPVTGEFSYTVDFQNRTGQGNIRGSLGSIDLHKGSIGSFGSFNYRSELDKTSLSGYGIKGSATSSQLGYGGYELGFFGNNAEEVVGVASFKYADLDIGFGGKR